MQQIMTFTLWISCKAGCIFLLHDEPARLSDRQHGPPLGKLGISGGQPHKQPVRLFDLMDLNQTFLAYDTPDGANCMTTGNRKMSQRDAAVEAVKNIGLNQKDEIKDEWFKGREKEREMFWCRFGILKEQWKA